VDLDEEDRHDFVQDLEVSPHQIVGNQISNALVEFGGALEVGKQEGETRDLEALIYVKRIGAINIAECLVGQETFRRQERPTFAEEIVKLVAGHPDTGERGYYRSVLQRNLQRAWSHLNGLGRRVILGHDEGERLAFVRRLALHFNELRHVDDRIEHDHKCFGQLHR